MEIYYNLLKWILAPIKKKLSGFKYRSHLTPFSAFAAIEYYQRTFIPFYSKEGELRIAIRQFLTNQEIFFLLVNPYNYQTSCSKS